MRTKRSWKPTNKQRDLIFLICKDQSSKEIAELLGLPYKSVENAVSRMLRAVNVKSRLGLVVYCLEKKIIKRQNLSYELRSKTKDKQF